MRVPPASILATTYKVVFDADKEYHANPNPVTKARLESAEREVALFQTCSVASFVVLPILAVLTLRLLKKLFSSKAA